MIDCNRCSHGMNCLNGRYCKKHKSYVEYGTKECHDYEEKQEPKKSNR